MKSSFIATFYNEEKTIKVFLKSLFTQSELPDEIILVDGASTDSTVQIIENEFKVFKKQNKKVVLSLLIKKGNRSIGRNEAIKHSTSQIILSSDAGCILDRNWVKNILKPFSDKHVDVVAGFYKGIARSIFQKCLIPYVLVMPDKVNEDNFLPATRTMAFKKSIWRKACGFDEKYSHNEDYVFAHKLKEIKAKIKFERRAIVNWMPRSNFKQAFTMFFRFAYGDAEASIVRPKVVILFARYLFVVYFAFLCGLYRSKIGVMILVALLICYILWSIAKNYRYIKDTKAFYLLPMIQLVADSAVLSGTMKAFVGNIIPRSVYKTLKKNLFLVSILVLYILILITTLKWGIPSFSHPFPYHMDEWHQLQAVRATVKFGTPNVAGAANGTMFHFILSALYLVPFTLVGFINPAVIKITDFVMRERIFELLRISTILYGTMSIVVFYKIAKLLKVNYKLAIFLFVFNPLWLTLSGYFKYDIALTFWTLVFFLSTIYYAKKPNALMFVLSSIPASIAIAVKVSAIPLLPIYALSYFFFQPKKIENIKYLFLGIFTCLFLIVLFGLPDTLFGKGNILSYLYDNIIHSPQISDNLQIGANPYIYLFTKHYSLIFGHLLYILFLVSIVIKVASIYKNGITKYIRENKLELLLIFSAVIFLLSILPLKIYAAGNRSLVLLPFIVLLFSLFIKKITVQPKWSKLMVALFCVLVSAQLLESYSWMRLKAIKSPQQTSSDWIISNVKKGSTIGLENIPIYQFVPDFVQKEFYLSQYNLAADNRYKYQIIDASTKKLPENIIITNDEAENRLLKRSPKIDLLQRVKKEKFKRVKVFYPDIGMLGLYVNQKDFYLSGLLIAIPTTISIYQK